MEVIAESEWSHPRSKWDHSTVKAAILIGADLQYKSDFMNSWSDVHPTLHYLMDTNPDVRYRAIIK